MARLVIASAPERPERAGADARARWGELLTRKLAAMQAECKLARSRRDPCLSGSLAVRRSERTGAEASRAAGWVPRVTIAHSKRCASRTRR